MPTENPPARKDIRRVVNYLDGAKRILFITGAGISAESGLPTYRGIGGLYNRGLTDEGVPIEVALSGTMMQLNPQVCWKYIAQMEETCRGAQHNRAHAVLAEMEEAFDEVWVLTQNVDGFHRDAGSSRVIDIHGDIHTLGCTSCGAERWVDDFRGLDIPPSCPECDAMQRPRVVLFGELLPIDKVRLLQEQLLRGFDVVFSIGTSSLFPYIAQPVVDASARGTPTVEINPEATDVSRVVDVRMSTTAVSAMDTIWSTYKASL